MAGTLRKRTIQTLEAMGIPVEYSFHEDSPSQHEIDLRHTDALTMADSVMTFRLVVREAAANEGLYATFMPKPLEGVQGSGMHTHMSLFEGDENAFHDPGDPYNLSKVAKGFIAGLLHHAREITAITNQTVNSYKRLIPGFEAPVYISWARNNRSALIRVPVAKSKAQSTRIEYRAPDPATNPYLAFSVMLAAGLKGIEEGYELPTEAVGQHLRAHRRGAGGRGPRAAAAVAVGRARRHGAVRAGRRGPRRAHLRVVPAQQAPRVARVQDAGHAVRDRPLPAHAVSPARDGAHPRLPRPAAARAGPDARPGRLPVEGGVLGRGGQPHGARRRLGRRGGRAPTRDPESAWAFCRTVRKKDVPLAPLLLLVSGAQLADLELRDDLFDDFCLPPFHPRELEARLKHLFWKKGGGTRPELVEYGDAGAQPRDLPGLRRRASPLDLTYMEYELLKFLAQHPGKVFTREILLSRVWGYEYYGGARTVDVHIRRLRAKLGEEHAGLIQTVRSVGYRFGQSRWSM